MNREDGGRGCGDEMIHGTIQELSTDPVKSLDSGWCISTQKETRDGLDREMSIMEDTLNQSMTVVTGECTDS